MDAQQLSHLLREQATPPPHHIRLSSASIGTTDLSALVTEDLRRKDGTLFLVVDPASIPESPPAGGFTLAATVPVGADGFLGIDGCVGEVQFLVTAAIDVALTLHLPDSPRSWTFGQSFPEMRWLPFDQLTITGPTLRFATAGAPPAGLSFAGALGLTGPLESVVKLLNAPSDHALDGTVSGSGDTFDVALSADLGMPPVSVANVVTLNETGVGVELKSLQDDGTVDRLALIYLYAKISVMGADGKAHPITAQASMPFGSGPPSDITIGLIPAKDSLVASLGSLGSMLGGATWDSFFDGNAAKAIKDKFDSFGLKYYSATFNLPTTQQPTPSLASMTLAIGTGSPWTLWDGYTVTLDANWTVTFIDSKPTSYLLVAAAFDFRTLKFVITVDSNLRITGKQRGQLPPLSLSDLNDKVFEKKVAIPHDLLVVQVGDFSLDIDIEKKTFDVGAVVNVSVKLFGTQILAIRQMAIGMEIDLSGPEAKYVGRLDGQVSLGPIAFQTDAVVANKAANVHTVFSLHLVDETVGSLINHLIHLVDPTYDLTLPSPWDKLLAISLDALVLKVDVTAGSVEIAYTSTIDLGFLTITELGLSYTKAGGDGKPSATKVQISGTLLGQPFGGPDPQRPALSWDPVRDNPPSVPGKGSSLFDLRYAGLGQHVGFAGTQPATVEEAIKKLKDGMTPVQPGQLPAFGGDGGLSFQGGSDWLIGADLTVADTVSVSAIFNDPNLYGILLKLSGEKAKIFAGLSLEILYRKVTDTIGVYHVELKLPDAMRHLEFGEVSVTLPVVVLDIYTNGNFRIDFGFPKGLDFSNSFSVQVFPFVGYGGFYLAVLDGATSSRVPQITNGTWSPVVEFGVALQIGVGKTIDEGVLSGGISVTVVGIVQGVLAWFHPTDASPRETYYWIQGTIAVTGHLYAKIDFAIIQASIDVTAYIGVTLTIESHKPIYIEAKASVSVRVSVKIIFFTIHLSFSATVDASFTIGSATPTPWKVASGAVSSHGPTRLLRGQRTLYAATPRHAGLAKALRAARAAAAEPPPITEWPAVLVLPGGHTTLPLWALPAFTTAESWVVANASRSGGTVIVTTAGAHDLDAGDVVTLSGTAGAGFDGVFSVLAVPQPTQFTFPQAGGDAAGAGGTATGGRAAHAGDGVILLGAGNSIAPTAVTGAEHHALAGDEPASAPFNLLMELMLRWGIVAAGGETRPTTVTADLLAQLRRQLQDADTVAAAFDYATLTSFLAANVTFDVTPAGDQPATGVALFPMIPAITLTDTSGADVDFATFTPVGADYVRAVRRYFAELEVQFQSSGGDTGAARAEASASGGVPSMASVVFGQYFNMLMSTAVKAAIDTLAAYPVQTDAAMSIADVGAAIGDATLAADPLRVVSPSQTLQVLATDATLALPDVVQQVPAGGTFASVAGGLAKLGATNGGSAYAAQDLIAANTAAGGIFVSGTEVTVDGITYDTQPGDTLQLVVSRLLARAAGPGFPNTVTGLSTRVQSLLDLNAGNDKVPTDPDAAIDPATTVTLATQPTGVVYTTVAGDTLTWIAAYTLAPSSGTAAAAIPDFTTALLALNPSLPDRDPHSVQPTGTQLTIPPVTRAFAPGDSLDGFAEALVTTSAVVAPAVLAADAKAPVLQARAALHAPLSYPVQSADTFAGIAAKFDLTLADVAAQAARAGAIFAADKAVVVGDVAEIAIDTLVAALLQAPDPKAPVQGRSEWNTAAGMVSRFLLSGLRLPDPHDANLGNGDTAAVRTKPLLALTGQRWPAPVVAQPPQPPDLGAYAITLANSAGAAWLTLAGSTSATFQPTADQVKLLQDVAWTAVTPDMDAPARLALYRMAPPRIALPQHVAWQAASRPPGCLTTAATTGNPSIWPFPDALVLQLRRDADAHEALLYQPVVARHHDSAQPITPDAVGCYAWATIVELTVTRPQTDGAAASVADAYVVEGADDAGAALLQHVYAQLDKDGSAPPLFLLYPPDANAGNASGLASDALDAAGTFLLKTNLSTLTHSGGLDAAAVAASDPTGVYAAPLANPKDFIALLWEASVTRSGGFYLQYASGSGSGLPPTAFGSGSSATLSLLVFQDGPMQPHTNCVVIGDSIDTTVASVFVQPATQGVQPGDTLTTVFDRFQEDWATKLEFKVADVAAANAAVPLVLATGAELAVPGSTNPYVVEYGDTLDGIVAKLGAEGFPVTLASLVAAGGNETSPILAAGATMQLVPGVLRPVSTVPPGAAGFEITRANPDPQNLPWDQLSAGALVDTLYNLVGWSVAGAGAFRASGKGLPTTPTAAAPAAPDGLSLGDADDSDDTSWYYSQAVGIAALGSPQHGSTSAAMPPPAANPYNGVGRDAVTGALNRVTLDLWLQDVYGNAQPLPDGLDQLDAPVGYYDDLIGPASWPAIALSYVVSGPPAAIDLSLGLQQTSYVPSTSVSVGTALAAIAADLASYTAINYQLAQPDLTFALQTTLALDDAGKPVANPLPKAPFAAFARGAYVYLAARSTLEAVQVDVTAGTPETLAGLTGEYGVTGAALFSANQERSYESWFGAMKLHVPLMYSVVAQDSLDTIVALPRWKAKGVGPTVADLASANANVPLAAAVSLAVPPRTVPVAKSGALADTAAAANASVAGLGAANQKLSGLFAKDAVLTLGTKRFTATDTSTLLDAAGALGGTVGEVAVANQNVPALLAPTAQLAADDRLTVDGDTLMKIATDAGQTVAAFAAANAGVGGLWPVGTQVQVADNPKPTDPTAADTLAGYAGKNFVTVEQLGDANASAATGFAEGAAIAIPGALQAGGRPSWSTYSAGTSDRLGDVARRYGAQPADIATLNADIHGLLAGGQRVVDATSGKSVTTEDGDSFDDLVARFAALQPPVTVTVAALGADVAAQDHLLVPQSLWIAPPLRADGGGDNRGRSLGGLASAYGIDLGTLATANAATIGFLAAGVAAGGLSTTAHDTLNSLVTRGVAPSVAEVAELVKDVPGLVAADAPVMPVPPPSPPGNGCTIAPKTADAVFQVSTTLVASRDAKLVDPDFADASSVVAASSSLPPEPDPDGKGASDPFTLVHFASALQAAIPGLHVAVGDPVAEGDPASLSTVWAVNLAATSGPTIGWRFQPSRTEYFALPPLSRSLMGGQVDVPMYVTGQDPPYTTQPQNFQGVDLDALLNTFAAAVDLFLSPSYAVPAYSLASSDVLAVVEAKKTLAEALSARVENVFSDGGGAIGDAQAAMCQALLGQLGAVTTVSTLVQVPVDVTSPTKDPVAAPRLSGKVVPATGLDAAASPFTFSTAKVPLTATASNATVLFSVKSPAAQSEASLDLQYCVTELERPDPQSAIGDYEGSSWLKFVLPLDPSWSALPGLKIPVPLRAYPSPVTLISQQATQSVPQPAAAADLLPWDLSFVYQHDDAMQDTPLVEITFNAEGRRDAFASASTDPRTDAIFQALARFIAVWPALQDDLALLASVRPGSPGGAASSAVKAFAQLVTGVATAFTKEALGSPFIPPAETYCYTLQRTAPQNPSTQGTLTVTAVDPTTGEPKPNPVELWPTVYVEGETDPLAQLSKTKTGAEYQYPAGFPWDRQVAQRFVFTWDDDKPLPPPPPLAKDVTLVAPQTFQFAWTNTILRQNARAGVSIWRNLSLVPGRTTAPEFVYQTPITAFASNATPSVVGSKPIPLTGSSVADALGTFLGQLVTPEAPWAEGETLTIRLAGGYSYALAETSTDELDATVPIFLVASYDFDPSNDWKVEPGSFVSQVESAIENWASGRISDNPGAYYAFDLTVFAGRGTLQPAIHATTLRYPIPST